MAESDRLFKEFYGIITRLRAPDGCPWDRKQTAESMKGSLLEETYEALDAINEKDDEHLKEELGDVLLDLAMIVRIKEEAGSFSMDDVLRTVNDKLIRRHPHVFGNVQVRDADEVLKNWNEIKEKVEGRKKKEGLSAVSKGYPSLERAYKIQKQAAKVGFDWDDIEDVLAKLEEEVAELKSAIARNESRARQEEELGDILFSAVNVSRFIKADPSAALHGTNEKFIRRFEYVESEMKKLGIELNHDNFLKMDSLWNRAKE
ncbi:MAG: nucleoside triphosphate pyrophosphohydrolase, partial [Spirochaetia bacterium]|nr:nucleoside triphosphate pyrophosphohydrolase [Spirochaetia bacterium]